MSEHQNGGRRFRPRHDSGEVPGFGLGWLGWLGSNGSLRFSAQPALDAARRSLEQGEAHLESRGEPSSDRPVGSQPSQPSQPEHPFRHTPGGAPPAAARSALPDRSDDSQPQHSKRAQTALPCIRHGVHTTVVPTPRTTVAPSGAAPRTARITVKVTEVDPLGKRPPTTGLQREELDPSPSRPRRSICMLRLLPGGEQLPSDASEERS